MTECAHEIVETKDVLIPMRDGVRLAANLILPVDAGPVPAVVLYFPYLKDLSGRREVLDWQRHFARRGYACLTVDIRGTGASEGVMAPCNSASEKIDAYDMLEWIAGRPWCDGITGMWGISYSGSTSLAAASMRPPSLKAIIPLHGTANEYHGFLRPHRCRPGWWTEANWGPFMMLLSLLPPLHRDPDRRWARVWEERLGRVTPPGFNWHQVPFDEYMSWGSDSAQVQAATFAVSGWHDYYPQATLDFFNDIPAPKRVMIGTWKHEFPDLAVRGGMDFLTEMDRWWDRWLKNVDNGADREPPVIIWRQGEEIWGLENAWPPAGTDEFAYVSVAGGRLALDGNAESGSDRYHVDPTVGLHMLPWDPQVAILPMPHDRSADDHRALTYTSEPLTGSMEILGQPVVTVSYVSDVAEFPLSVWLADVAPNGHSTLICQGWLPVRSASGTIEVPLYSTSYLLPAGHRLRLGLAGAHFPLLWPAARNPTIDVAAGANGTFVKVPIAPRDRVRLPAPEFGRPAAESSNRGAASREASRIIDNWVDQSVAFEDETDVTRQLDQGATIRIVTKNRSSISRNDPAGAVMSAHLVATIEGGGETTIVAVEALQTNERYRIDGAITIDGRPFFDRTWELAITDPRGSA